MDTSYEQAVVSFLDVLGFADFVKDSEKHPEHIPEIRRNLEILREQFKGERYTYPIVEGREQKPEPLFRAYSFSDLTVRATLVRPEPHITPEENLRYILMRELMVIADRQLEFACWYADEWEVQPVLLRGGISLGSITMDPNKQSDEIIFGPALVRSYELEKSVAVYPRIVIDRELVRKTKADEWGNLVKQGDDGVYFLNYLCGCQELEEQIMPQPVGNQTTTLDNHKKTIEKAISQLKSSGKMDERKLQKYLWLIKYHNSVVGNVPDPVTFPSFMNNCSDDDVFSGVNRKTLHISENII